MPLQAVVIEPRTNLRSSTLRRDDMVSLTILDPEVRKLVR